MADKKHRISIYAAVLTVSCCFPSVQAPIAADMGPVEPGTVVFQNERSTVTLFWTPDPGGFVSDDLVLTEPFGCSLVQYEILVSGDEGGTYDVHVELWDADPCEGGAAISGTEGVWRELPSDGQLHRLSITLPEPVGIPGVVWMQVGFSNQSGGWVIAERAEVGSTENFFSLESPAAETCGLFFFGPGPPFLYSGFWTVLRCDLAPPPTGACCRQFECNITTKAECSGHWRGAGTGCGQNPCGPSFVVYDSHFFTGEFLPLVPGTRVGDDVLLAEGATPCQLFRYVAGVAGRSSSPSFAATTELWTNHLGPDGVLSDDDLPLAPIPGTRGAFAGIRANGNTQLLAAGPFPGGVVLPEKLWLVLSTTTEESGPILVGKSEVGFSEDAYAVHSAGDWVGGRDFGGQDLQDCPHGAQCVPAGSFRALVQCYGDQARGACCGTVSDQCSDGMLLHECQGRWQSEVTCETAIFDPPCGTSACPSGEPFVFVDPPDGVVDARQPHPPNDALQAEGIRTLIALGPPGARRDCFGLCDSSQSGPLNDIESIFESPKGMYTITLNRPLVAGTLTTVTFAGTVSTGRFHAHPGNVDGDGVVGTLDVRSLMACLDGINPAETCPWGFPYSQDINQDGVFSPSDILRAIDLVNGAENYQPWSDTPLPNVDCP